MQTDPTTNRCPAVDADQQARVVTATSCEASTDEGLVAAIYPADLVREHTLGDGRRVVIRPVRGEDAPLISTFLEALAPESRYLRFQKWIAGAPEALVRFLVDVDYDRHFAVVCVVPDAGRDSIVGDARYVAAARSDRCEFGIVIADGWHKTGIAGLLMATLIRAARDRGFSTMEGQVFHANREMLRFARALGFDILPSADDKTIVRVARTLRDGQARGDERR